MPIYYIDKEGGRHYHKKGCPMTLEPRYHYEAIFRTKTRQRNLNWGFTRIRLNGRFFIPCPNCFIKPFNGA
jgi:hypothetical protein